MRKIFWVSLSRMLVSFSSQRHSESESKKMTRVLMLGSEEEKELAFGMAITIIIKFNYSNCTTHGNITHQSRIRNIFGIFGLH